MPSLANECPGRKKESNNSGRFPNRIYSTFTYKSLSSRYAYLLLLASVGCVVIRSFSFSKNEFTMKSTKSKGQDSFQNPPFQYLPCQISQVSNSIANTTLFKTTPISTWKCRQEISDSYTLIFVDLQIKECPPNYSSSTFQLEGSTVRSRIM